MRKESTILRVLNKYLDFRLRIPSDYSREEEYITGSIEELQAVCKDNSELWKKHNTERAELEFYTQWKDRQDQFSSAINACRNVEKGTMKEDTYEIIRMFLHQFGISLYEYDFDPNKKVNKEIRVEAPYNKSADFEQNYEFCKWYIENRGTEYLSKALSKYISLCQNNSNLGNAISSSSSYESFSALYFMREKILGNKTDWDRISETVIQNTAQSLTTLSKEFNKSSQSVREHLESIKNESTEHLDSLTQSVASAEERLKILEHTYQEKLKLEAPEVLWNEKTKEYQRAMRVNYGAAISVGVLFFVGLAFGEALLKRLAGLASWLSPAIILAGFVSLIVYLMRVFIKQAHSNAHLMVACKERAALTRFYQALVYAQEENSGSITEEERLLIFKALFTPVDSGLVRTSDNNDLEALMSSILKRP